MRFDTVEEFELNEQEADMVNAAGKHNFDYIKSNTTGLHREAFSQNAWRRNLKHQMMRSVTNEKYEKV